MLKQRLHRRPKNNFCFNYGYPKRVPILFKKKVIKMFEEIKKQALDAVKELCEVAKLQKGSVLVIGCSTSEILGEKIGTHSSIDAAKALYDAIYGYLTEKGIYIAAQCCEHLNRALIVERELAEKQGLYICNVIPQPKAGGSSATTAYGLFSDPVAVEHIKADAGIDIGGTLIGMHIRETCVPVRLSIKKIGNAYISCARSRPKFIGGSRAVYDESLL